MKADYARLIAAAHIRPECEQALRVTAQRLLHDKAVYTRIFEATGVPVAVLMAIAEREMSGNLHCYLGNGERLTHRTTLVPKGRGPWADTPDGFYRGALDALHLDGLDQVAKTAEGWTMPRAGFESEEWNGWGYRGHGIPSPYFVGGTTVQRRGKYVHDGVYDSSVMDPQLGTLAIMEELFKLDPSLVFDGQAIEKVAVDEAPSIVPDAHPVIGGNDDIEWVQKALNALKLGAPLLVDGNLGRGTRAAVRQYEVLRHLDLDRGYPGPQVIGTLRGEIAQKQLVLQ
jgi:lysozyme family protein